MLKKNLIPTPLVTHSAGKGAPPKPVRYFRVFYILGLIYRSMWYVLMIRYRPGGKYTTLGLAKIVTAAFERLGGLWIKMAQIIAMRRDLFSKEFCDEISRLHDRAHGFPGEVARKIIEEDLGKPIDEVFKDFQTVPIAAASIGQVHVAWLRDNGKKVAVKVQRPAIVDSFRQDLGIIKGYFKLLRIFGIMSWAKWDEMYDSLERTMVEELDYRLEVASMRRMRKTLKQDRITSPKAYTSYCSKRVLTMEFLDGVLMSDFIHVLVNDPKRAKAWCKENKIKVKRFGRKLFLSMVKQIWEDNLLHGDLHPGNIMMLRKSRIAYIDFGSVSILDMGFLAKYNVAIRALTRKDFSKYADAFITLVPGIPMDTDIDELKKQMVRDIQEWETLTDAKGIPYEQRSLTALNGKLAAVTGKFEFAPDWSSLRLLRSMTALDASFRFVLPNVNFFKIMKSFYDAQRLRTIKHMASKNARQDISFAVSDMLKIPPLLGDQMLFQADLVRKRAMNFSAGITKAAKIGRALVRTLINIGLIATVFVLARFLSKQQDIGQSAIAKSPIRDVFGSMPTLSPGMWVVVIILSIYLLRSLRNLAEVLGVTSSGTNPFLKGS
jgi:ubiquinone biosynthesis protein